MNIRICPRIIILSSVLTVLCLYLVGCIGASDQNVDGDYICINTNNLTVVDADKLDISFESVECVVLETVDKCLFSDILQLITTDSAMYLRVQISDMSSDAKILKYARSGKFEFEIGNMGQAPGEYNSADYLIVKGDSIVVFDRDNQNIVVYSANDGRHISSTPINGCREIQQMNGALFDPYSDNFLMTADVIFGDDVYSLGLYNLALNKFEKLMSAKFEVDGWVSHQYANPSIARYTMDYALFLLPLDDYVYKYDFETKTVSKFCCITNGVEMPDFKDGMLYGDALMEANDKGALRLSGLFYANDYLIVDNHSNAIIFNIVDNKGYYVRGEWDVKSCKDFPFVPSKLLEATQKYGFVCSYSANTLLRYLEYHKENTLLLNEEIAEILTEESNPVLVYYK